MQFKEGLITRVVRLFLTTRLSIVFILLSLALGLAALVAMPKEEDPQIVVPMADVMVSAPGASAEEVQTQVATPLEQLLLQIKGVEDVYSTAQDGQAVVTVKFHVGTNQEQALVRLNNQIQMHADEVPSIVKNWIVKPVSIDDVPIVNIVLYSSRYSPFELHQIGQEVLTQLSQMPDISKTSLIGGTDFQARIVFDPAQLAAVSLTSLDVMQAIQASDVALLAGSLVENNQQKEVEVQAFLKSPQALKNLVVSNANGKAVYLEDVAKVLYGSSETTQYTNIGFVGKNQSYNAVTLGLAKKSGTNAVSVANEILARVNVLKQTLIPQGVSVGITRNYGETAHGKVDELIYSLGLAILTVIVVLVLSLGWRESMIVAVSVPISFALALFVDYLFGYSINRVTLFALILSLGLVVDDPITNVENIQRHIRLKNAGIFEAILTAVNEVLPPVIMSSLTIIVSFLPLFFISGMMGPYMSPMAATVPLTIVFSTVASLTIVPWMAYKLLGHRRANHDSTSLNSNHADSVTPK
jgi:multidrug efflux pump subunit AcrB